MSEAQTASDKEMNNMEYTMKDIIKSSDLLDWCMVALIITLLGMASWWAYLYENTGILSGVGLGAAIGALAMGLGMTARDHKEDAKRERQE